MRSSVATARRKKNRIRRFCMSRCGDFNFRRLSAVIVGDGDTDIEAGKRAGVMTCGVTYGLGDKERADRRGAGFVDR